MSAAVGGFRRAPVFSPKVLQGSGVVGGTFTEWTHHYNGCADCQREDWYAPDAVERFCREGKHLFEQWARATATSQRIY